MTSRADLWHGIAVGRASCCKDTHKRDPQCISAAIVPRPRGSRYLILRDLGLKDHDYDGFWDLIPQGLHVSTLGPNVYT